MSIDCHHRCIFKQKFVLKSLFNISFVLNIFFCNVFNLYHVQALGPLYIATSWNMQNNAVENAIFCGMKIGGPSHNWSIQIMFFIGKIEPTRS